MKTIVRHDTKAWKLQSWVSFAVAVIVCGSGLSYLPGSDIEQAFMFMGYVFCLSAVFMLSKFIRDRAEQNSDTPMWSLVVWAAFGLAVALTGWGLLRMDISPTYKAYLVVTWLFLMSSAFTLAKMLRDEHDAHLAEQSMTINTMKE